MIVERDGRPAIFYRARSATDAVDLFTARHGLGTWLWTNEQHRLFRFVDEDGMYAVVGFSTGFAIVHSVGVQATLFE